ncbi:hypothetical protein Nepgr_030850 [Nepenthes gracilis]|uniref:Uncharacterized protein n=1 Tax=Nepenthes gracilis TaxID=150966 RepID=A0AAD3Y466_NEPGR|nr:hypothetical protein Nepgr_030850 [Nepenthes gracilis]
MVDEDLGLHCSRRQYTSDPGKSKTCHTSIIADISKPGETAQHSKPTFCCKPGGLMLHIGQKAHTATLSQTGIYSSSEPANRAYWPRQHGQIGHNTIPGKTATILDEEKTSSHSYVGVYQASNYIGPKIQTGIYSSSIPVNRAYGPRQHGQTGQTGIAFNQDAVLPTKIFLSKHPASEAELLVKVEVESPDKSKRVRPSTGKSPKMGAMPITCPQTSSCSAGDHVEKKLVAPCDQVATQIVAEVIEEAPASRPPPMDADSLGLGDAGPVVCDQIGLPPFTDSDSVGLFDAGAVSITLRPVADEDCKEAFGLAVDAISLAPELGSVVDIAAELRGPPESVALISNDEILTKIGSTLDSPIELTCNADVSATGIKLVDLDITPESINRLTSKYSLANPVHVEPTTVSPRGSQDGDQQGKVLETIGKSLLPLGSVAFDLDNYPMTESSMSEEVEADEWIALKFRPSPMALGSMPSPEDGENLSPRTFGSLIHESLEALGLGDWLALRSGPSTILLFAGDCWSLAGLGCCWMVWLTRFDDWLAWPIRLLCWFGTQDSGLGLSDRLRWNLELRPNADLGFNLLLEWYVVLFKPGRGFWGELAGLACCRGVSVKKKKEEEFWGKSGWVFQPVLPDWLACFWGQV